MELHFEDILNLDEVFDKKKWSKDDRVYNSLLELLAFLSENQKIVFFKMLSCYEVYRMPQYHSLLDKGITLIPKEKLDSYEIIVFLPVKYPLNSTESKSGDVLPYIMRTQVAPNLTVLKGKNCEYLSTPLDELLRTTNFEKDEVLIVALDDYIGSGRTVYKFFRNMRDEYGVKFENMISLSLVCMERAKKFLSTKAISSYSGRYLKRGISDNPVFAVEERGKALDEIRAVTEKLKIGGKNYRGYKKSEALVTMMNTPNNTFPVFWVEYMSDGALWPAPFRRV